MAVTIEMLSDSKIKEGKTVPDNLRFNPVYENMPAGTVEFVSNETLAGFINSGEFDVLLCIGDEEVLLSQASMTSHQTALTKGTYHTVLAVSEASPNAQTVLNFARLLKADTKNKVKGKGDDPTSTTGEIIVR